MFEQLPKDILLLILKNLPMRDAFSLGKVNKLSYLSFKEEDFWKHLLEYYYPDIAKNCLQNSPQKINYFEMFKFCRQRNYYRWNLWPHPHKGEPISGKELKRTIHLFNLAKEGDLKSIQKLCQKENKSMANLLAVGQFAEYKLYDSKGRTPFHWICNLGYQMILDAIYQECFRKNLFWMIACNQQDAVEQTINNGADVNRIEGYVYTPLFLAAIFGHYAIAEFLIKKNAAVNHTPGFAYCSTPLAEAAKYGHEEIVKLLIKHKATVNYPTWGSVQTPLYFASANGHHRVVELLIEAGANINYAPRNGETPLFAAVRYDNYLATKLLIEKGADVNYKSGLTRPIHFTNNSYITQLLIQNGLWETDKTKKELKNLLTMTNPNLQTIREKAIALYEWYKNQSFIKHWFHHKKEATKIVELLKKENSLTLDGFKKILEQAKDKNKRQNQMGHFSAIKRYIFTCFEETEQPQASTLPSLASVEEEGCQKALHS